MCRSLKFSIFWAIAFAGLEKEFRGRKRRSEHGFEVGGGIGTSTAQKVCVCVSEEEM